MGLGFRDIHGFNLALLGKQCWSLINRPNTLVARFLKAMYYPNCHLLQAGRTGGASFTWSRIWQAKENMQSGLRWVLGDGTSINIAKDRWLRAKPNYCVDSTVITTQLEQMKVKDFFQQNVKAWDENKVKLHFIGDDATAILNTRIPQGCAYDRIAWVHSRSG